MSLTTTTTTTITTTTITIARKEYLKKYREDNKEQYAEYQRKYREKNLPALKTKSKAKYAVGSNDVTISEYRREYSRIYYQKHKEVMKMRQKWQRTWRIHNNPAYYNDLLLIDPTLFS